MLEGRLAVEGAIPHPLDREFTIVGKSFDRRDGAEKVTGRAKYSSDITLPNMLYAKILRCPHPRARIVKIDTRKAESLPGVKAVLSKENTKGWYTYWYWVPQIAFPEYITYEGQEVAAIGADNIEIAQRALELIDVEYEVLEPVIDPEEALNTSRTFPLVGEEYPGSEIFDRKEYFIKRGDIETAFDESDSILADWYTTQAQYHGTIQTRACVAHWDGHHLTIWDAIQGVWNSKETVAKSLGLDFGDVRVIVKYLGGGFGSKAYAQRHTFYAAKLSMLTGRPVKLVLTRREEFLSHPRRWDCRIYLKMGVKKNGKLMAIYQRAIVNVGAAASPSNYFPSQIIWHTSNLYPCPNVHLEQIGVYTNSQLTGPQRGPLNMPAIFALESHIDRLAEELGMDPLEFRLKNYGMHGHTVYGKVTSPHEARSRDEGKIPYSSKNLDKCMKLVTESIGWERRKSSKNTARDRVKRGIGMASFIAHQGVGLAPYAAHADINIEKDGTISLLTGVVDIGGGQQTILTMIAAEELGVKLDDITTVWGDTEGTRYTPSCHASRATAEIGPAVLQAAAQARHKLFGIAAPMLGANVEELQSKNGSIFLKSDPSRSISFQSVCSKIDSHKPIKGSGSRAPNPNSHLFATFGAQAVELEVDTETGDVTILRVAAAQDFGRPINPKFCTSQIYGGISQFGIGYALSEEGIFDAKTGRLLNTSFSQYMVPTSFDAPLIDAILVEGEDPYFAYSAKGAGENSNTATPAAIRNAVFDAVGIWINDLPMTPNKIMNQILRKKSTG